MGNTKRNLFATTNDPNNYALAQRRSFHRKKNLFGDGGMASTLGVTETVPLPIRHGHLLVVSQQHAGQSWWSLHRPPINGIHINFKSSGTSMRLNTYAHTSRIHYKRGNTSHEKNAKQKARDPVIWYLVGGRRSPLAGDRCGQRLLLEPQVRDDPLRAKWGAEWQETFEEILT